MRHVTTGWQSIDLCDAGGDCLLGDVVGDVESLDLGGDGVVWRLHTDDEEMARR
jgi:hypothetical protein